MASSALWLCVRTHADKGARALIASSAYRFFGAFAAVPVP